MKNILRLFALFLPDLPWLLLGGVLAGISLALSIAVFQSAAFLLAGAAAAYVLRAAAGGRVVARYFERLATHGATFRTLARLRIWLYRRLIPLAPLQLGMSRSGDTLSRLTADIDALDGLYLRVVLPLALLAITTLGGLVWLASWNMPAALVILCVLVAAMVSFTLLAHKAAPYQRDLLQHQAELRAHVIDGVEGLSELLACGAGHQQAAVIARSTSALIRDQLALSRLQSRATFISQIIQGGFLIILLGFGWPLAVSGQVDSKLVIFAVLGFIGASELLGSLPLAFLSAPRLAAAAGRLFDMADRTPWLAEPVTPATIPADTTISFNNVDLAYERGTTILHNITLTLKPGERVALMGSSGAGKSSLAMLLLRFAAPSAGNITIGGVDLAQLEGDAWRARIGYLSQHNRLIAGSIADNLRLAKPDASTAELMDALAAVELDALVSSLPEGLETWVGEDGLQLSGGQARRLSLAMVVLRNAPIWVLDEPTEGLDAGTAQAVLTTLGQLAKGRTLLLITHDESTLQPLEPQRLVLLEGGRITSDGAI